MALLSPPPELMTAVAQKLIAAALDLGQPATVVATTSDGPLGLGFLVPDDVYEHYLDTHVTLVRADTGMPREPAPDVEVPDPDTEEKASDTEEIPPVPEEKPRRGPRGTRKTEEA